MSHFFYGVYIKDPQISAALDLVRFLAEPDALRFSHITLRGPYQQELSSLQLEQVNDTVTGDWSVYLSGPGYFFSPKQNTVMLRVGLNGLQKIVKKPDYKDAVAHITLYDGGDRIFAQSLLEAIHRFDLYRRVPVTHLIKIGKKAPVARNFIEFYPEFRNAYYRYIGSNLLPDQVADIDATKRLSLITNTLEQNFSRHFDKLLPPPVMTLPENLDFGFPRINLKDVSSFKRMA